MNGEMYVVQLVKTSERARSVASRILRVASRERQLEVLKELNLVQQLTGPLDCSEQTVFTEFARRIRDELMRHSPSSFTLSHLQLLDADDVQIPLDNLLHCEPGKGLLSLFDPVKMKMTLQKVNPTQAESALLASRSLLHAILLPQHISAIGQRYDVDFNSWGEFIQDEKWLKAEAIQWLRDYANGLNWPTEHPPMSILAAFLDDLQEGKAYQGTEYGQVFDKLALAYLRQHLLWVVESLREQAVKHAQQASLLDPSQPAYGHLPAWIELYERGAVLSAMPYLTPDRKPLSTFIPSANYKIVQSLEGKPDLKKHLLVEAKRTYEKGFIKKTTVGAFEIHCYLQGKEEAYPQLQCRGLPLDIYEHLIAVIPQLTGADLSLAGKTLPEQLLNTLVLVPDRFIRFVNSAVKELGPAFAQCLVLCGTPLPIELDIPGRADLNDKLPYKSMDSDNDIAFSRSASAIKDDILSSYHQKNRSVEPISSLSSGASRPPR
jgi:hypothetical protein